MKEIWAAYWGASSLPSGEMLGRSSAVERLDAYWRSAFEALAHAPPISTALELGCGPQPVLGKAPSRIVLPSAMFTLADISNKALSAAASQLSDHRTRLVVGDFADIRNFDDSYDLICSQFGLEYGGAALIGRYARLLSEGGRMVLVMHHSQSVLCDEARRNIEVASLIISENIFSLIEEKNFTNASQYQSKFIASTLEKIKYALDNSQNCPAKMFAIKFVSDLSFVILNVKNYDPNQLAHWYRANFTNVKNYDSISRALLDCALSQTDLVHATSKLPQAEFKADWRSLEDEASGGLLAWALTVDRKGRN